MSGMFGYSREAVRVKVKKCEGNLPPEWRKFSVDPQITSLEVLFSILAKAFDLKTDFGISYKAIDPTGHETYLPVLSDWDLDAAFLRAHNLSITTSTEPCLNLRVDIKPFSEAQDWDMAASQAPRESISLQHSLGVGQRYVQNVQNRLPGIIMNQMEKTLSMVQRALNLVEDPSISQPPRLPLCDSEFRGFLDSVGQIIKVNELRKVIYSGGIDPSLRRVVWKHILNVYPDGMTGRERMDYMKRKASEYYNLRDAWRAVVQKGTVIGELTYVTSMVRKDVLRTDRLHPFYAGSDDNQNIAALFNILTTYALNHPAVSYCQGMSDIASPLLVTMGDEAQAYICFCAVMTRLSCNFMLDGIAMTQKFTHLSEALQYYDPEFYEYLKEQQADDLLFCYRWLLLEMKREFAFEDSLRMLEVLWSSLPPAPPIKELALFEKKFEPPPIDIPPPKSPSVILRTPRENPYTKICALRRQSSALSLLTLSSHNASSNVASHKLDATKRMNHSLDENLTRYRSKSFTKTHQSLDESKIKLLSEIEQINLKALTENKQKSMNLSFNNDSYELDNKKKFGTVEEKLNETSEKPCKLLHNIENEQKHFPQQHHKQNNIHKHKTLSQINNKALFSYSTGNLMSKQGPIKKGGHFKDLKERIAASKKGIFSSLDKIENLQIVDSNNLIDNNEITLSETNIINDNSLLKKSTKGQKVVKNFNEFLNFASINKSRISEKLTTKKLQSITINDNKSLIETNNATKTCNDKSSLNDKPFIKLTKSSFEDSDIFDLNSPTASASNVKPLTLQLNTYNNIEHTINKQICNFDGSSPDDSQEYFPMTTSMTRELRLELENLDRHVFGTDFQRKRHQQELNILSGCDITPPEIGDCYNDDGNINKKSNGCKNNEITYEKLTQCNSFENVEIHEHNEETKQNNHDNDIEICNLPVEEKKLKRFSSCSINNDVFIWENPLHQFDVTTQQQFNLNVQQTLCNEMLNIDNDDKTIHLNNNNINCLNITTPDEQAELEYDGEIIEETINGKKSVTPIRLLRKNINEQQFLNKNTKSKIRNTTKKNFKLRNINRSAIISNNIDDTDSDENSDNSWHDNNLLTMKNNHDLLAKNFTQDNNRKLLINNDTINIINPAMTNSCEEAAEIGDSAKIIAPVTNHTLSTATAPNILLPHPNDFGGGNPFLMFLCLTLLLQHRDYVIKSNMDYNEMAMHFDKMVRKHNVTRVLNQARRMYSEYLKSETIIQNSNYNANSNLFKSSNALPTTIGNTITSPMAATAINTLTDKEHSSSVIGNVINSVNVQNPTQEINT